MLQLKPLDQKVPIFQQINTDVAPVVLVNVFQVAEEDIPALLKAWEADANWMKQQPGYISTQLHQGIAGSTVFMNYALWESVAHFRAAFTHPEFKQALGHFPSSVPSQKYVSIRRIPRPGGRPGAPRPRASPSPVRRSAPRADRPGVRASRHRRDARRRRGVPRAWEFE